MKKILITGANGFLGRNLVLRFLREKNKILAISRSSNNLKKISSDIEFLQIKDNQHDSLYSEIEKFQPDVVIHAAWDGGNSHEKSNSLDQFLKNIPQGNSLLKNIKPHTIFIGIGSFAEYGKLDDKAVESQIELPINFYGLSKLCFKEISKMYCTQNSIRWKWVRPCYVYGPGDVQTRLIPSIINKFLNNESIHLDMCEVLIDYLYIDDFCEAVLQILNSNTDGVYNVCSGDEYKLKNIINYIQELIKSNSSLLFDPNIKRTTSLPYICGDNTKLKTNTSWKMKYDLNSGLTETINQSKIKFY